MVNNSELKFNEFLNRFDSSKILVMNDYHGQLIHRREEYSIVIYSLVGEKADANEIINELKERYKGAYIFFISPVDYKNSIDVSYNGEFIHQPTGFVGYYSKCISYTELDDICSRNIIKHFLCLNNRADMSRHAIWQFMVKHDFLKLSYFSYLFQDRFQEGKDVLWKRLQEMTVPTWFNSGIDWEEKKNMIPLRLDDLDDTKSFYYGSTDYYRTSFLSLVNETYHSDFICEKSLKPIAYGQPFIIINCQRALSLLKNMGFKTFDNFIDESYDMKYGPENFEHCMREIIKLSKLSIIEIKDLLCQMSDTIKHNYNQFWNVIPRQDDQFIQSVIIPKIQSKITELKITI